MRVLPGDQARLSSLLWYMIMLAISLLMVAKYSTEAAEERKSVFWFMILGISFPPHGEDTVDQGRRVACYILAVDWKQRALRQNPVLSTPQTLPLVTSTQHQIPFLWLGSTYSILFYCCEETS